jgi:GINS complex subunit 4
MTTNWDDEYDAMMAADPPVPAQANNSFIDRVRRAAADGHNDDDLDRILGHSAEGRDYQLQRGQPSHKLPGDADTPLRRLIRHWMNERHAPDILPTQEELLSSLLDHIRRQVRSV